MAAAEEINPGGVVRKAESDARPDAEESLGGLLAQCVQRERLSLCLPTRIEIVEKIAIHLKDRAVLSGVCSPERACGLAIALTEALMNAMVHGNLEISSSLKDQGYAAFGELLARRSHEQAYAGRNVHVDADDDGTVCRWTIRNEGPGFDVQAVLGQIAAQDVADLEKTYGRGVLMIQAFMLDVHWRDEGRTLVMSMKRGGAVAAEQTQVQPLWQETVEQILMDCVEDGEGTEALPRRANGRKHPRLMYTRSIQVLPAGCNGPRWAVARNLSLDGLAFVMNAELHPGEIVEVLLETQSAVPARLWLRLVRCQRLARDFYDCGGEFVAGPAGMTAAL